MHQSFVKQAHWDECNVDLYISSCIYLKFKIKKVCQ